MSQAVEQVATSVPHVPGPDRRGPKVRKKLMFFDRSKIILGLLVYFGFALAKRHADDPLASWGEAIRGESKAKRLVFFIIAIELVRQAHYLACQKSSRYHLFWVDKVWGGWDRFWTRRNPWMRFRLLRVSKRLGVAAVAIVLLAYLWKIPALTAVAEAPGRVWKFLFSTRAGMPFIVEIAFILFISIIQFVAIFWFMSRGGVDTLEPDEVRERFDDVKGQDRVVTKVRETMQLLENPAEIERKGGHVPGGILLWGPPGTGKTLIAKACAGESGKPFVFIDPGAFQAMFMGVGIMKVKSLYKKLRKLSIRHGGVIAFFDEADSLGNRGVNVSGRAESKPLGAHPFVCGGLHYADPATAAYVVHQWNAVNAAPTEEPGRFGKIAQIINPMMGGGGGMGTLQAILTEMSGLEKPQGVIARRLRKFLNMPAKKPPKYRILHMMATNAPDVLDEALKRPGRLDRQFRVGFPTLEGRIATYNYYLDKIRHVLTQEQVERLALRSHRASGAVIKDAVNEAIMVAMREDRDVVTFQDLLEGRSLKTHGLPDEVHPMALERHAVALHEASHAVAMKRLYKRMTIDVATIEPRGDVGGFVSPVPLEEPGFPWRTSQEETVMTFLASLAGERHFFDGDNSVGVGGDMTSSTSIVMRMQAFAAMGNTLVSHSVPNVVDGDRWKTLFGDKVEEKMQELFARACRLIVENERWVMAVGHALEGYKTISGEDIDAIFDGTEGPLVDGAWYHSDDFMTQYRAYHAAALTAHKKQIRLELPLPRPSAPAPIEVAGSSTSPSLALAFHDKGYI